MSRRIDESEKERPLSVLVTGASGFLGSAIAEHLINAGLQVKPTGQSKLVPSKILPGYFRADITVAGNLNDALTNLDAVVHAAGLAHQFGGTDKPAGFRKANVKGTENVAKAVVGAGVKHLILVSSVSVYGPHGSEVCDEKTVCNPQDPYALSKYEAEQRAIEILHGSGVGLTILRFTTIYGEGDPGNVARLLRTIDRGRFVWVGDGSNRKSLVHVDDAARAALCALQHTPIGVNTYNVVGSVHTMREIVNGLASALGKKLPKWRMPPNIAKIMAISLDRISRPRKRAGRFERSVTKWLGDDVYNGSKFESKFKFSETVSLKEGLRREVEWYRQSAQKNEKGEVR